MQVLHQFLRLNTLLSRDIVKYVVYIGRVYNICLQKRRNLSITGEDLITIYVNYDPNSSVYHFISRLKRVYIHIYTHTFVSFYLLSRFKFYHGISLVELFLNSVQSRDGK